MARYGFLSHDINVLAMAGLEILLLVLIIAAVLNFLDASLGMGYGTTLTIILFLMGFRPDEVVFPILVSGVIAGFVSSLFHIIFKNLEVEGEKRLRLINISLDQYNQEIGENIKFSLESKSMSLDTKIILVFTICGIISAVLGAMLSTILYSIPESDLFIKIYIAILVLVLGIIILTFKGRTIKFAFSKIIIIGGLAGLNKSISGGGFGPIAVTGQMMVGREGKSAIASTSLSEAIISISGIVSYLLTNILLGGSAISYELIPWLTIGACITSPFASFTTKKLDKDKFKNYIAVGLIVLAGVILVRLLFP
ncbi:MAG: sulfite exporter TauE/SafE family protein [Candidatus Hodarchaeota archaeon]